MGTGQWVWLQVQFRRKDVNCRKMDAGNNLSQKFKVLRFPGGLVVKWSYFWQFIYKLAVGYLKTVFLIEIHFQVMVKFPCQHTKGYLTWIKVNYQLVERGGSRSRFKLKGRLLGSQGQPGRMKGHSIWYT